MPTIKSDNSRCDGLPNANAGLTKIELVAALLITTVLLMLLLPAIPNGHPQIANGFWCDKNLADIGIAVRLYHEEHGIYPPAYVADANGKPLYSWRVLLLPYLTRREFYKDFDKTKSWDAPENLPFLKRMPDVYRCGSQSSEVEFTSYVGLFGDDCFFSGSQGRSIASITDGTANTLVAIEAVDTRIPWTAPKDLNAMVDAVTQAALQRSHTHNHRVPADIQTRFFALFVDGEVRHLPKDMEIETWKRLCLVNDGKVIKFLQEEQ